MALDPSIVLGLRPPQIAQPEIQTPLDRFGKVLTLQHLMQQGQMGDIQLQQARQEMAATEAINRALAGDTSSPISRDAGAGLAQPLPYQPNESGPSTAQPLSDLSALGPRLLRAGGKYALPIVKSLNETQKSILEQQLKALDLQQGKVKDMATIASGITDESSKLAGVATAFSKGYIDAPTRDRLLSHPYSAKDYEVFQNQALDANQRLEQARANVKQQWEAHDQAQKDRQENLLNAWQDLQTVTDTTGVPAWLARQPKDVQQLFGGIAGLGDLNQIKMIVGSAAQKPAAGTTTPYPAAVQEQKVETQAAQGLRAAEVKEKFEEQKNRATIEAIKKDPKMWSTLSTEEQKAMRPYLVQEGFTEFGTKLSDTEVGKLTDFQKALQLADSLKAKLEANKDLIGPISGQLTHLPYATERKKLQADIDLGRQIIGKALEGGILHKEDEVKYRNILPTMTDTPEVAQAKLDQLKTMLERDYQTYRSTLSGTGRQLPPAGQAPKKAAPPEPGAILPGKDGKRWMFIGGDPRDQNNYKEWHQGTQ